MNNCSLVNDNIRLVHYVIHRNFPSIYTDYDDVFQEGCIGLLKAADGFDETKGEFRNYAYASILNQVRDYFRRNKQEVEILSLDYEMSHDEGETYTLMDTLVDDSSDKWFDKVERDSFIESLSDCEIKIVKLLKKGKTQTEIGEEFGVTRQRISAIVLRIKSKWRMYCEKSKN